MKNKYKKVVLAYSGGLDTSVALRWLLENMAEEVIAVTVNLGQNEDLEATKQKALKTGASHCEIIDAKEEFVSEYIRKAIFANCRYEFDYPVSTALARPLIASKVASVAQKYNADALAHGCTGKGNDQVRFELSWYALVPKLAVLAPARIWGELGDRSKAIQYARLHGIDLPVTLEKPFSIDANLWGRSVECGVLEDAWSEAPEEAYALTLAPKDCSAEPVYVEIEFDHGFPIALNGQALTGLALIEKLNALAGREGIGRMDQIENRLVGIKSREIYEAPAAHVLVQAHRELEYLVSPRDLTRFKASIDQKYSELIYDAQWFTPLREALDAFLTETQERVTGTIRLRLEKGKSSVVGRSSPYSLYNEDLASYTERDSFKHQSAEGFIELYGLPIRTYYGK